MAGRILIYVSPGETLSDAFPVWLRLAYDGHSYRPYDMNMPSSLPRRPPSQMKHDPPLTEHGEVVSQLTGRIYCGPELRCVQTASAIARTLPYSSCRLFVEGSLCAWRALFPVEQQWIAPKELLHIGFPVDISYRPFLSQPPLKETVVEYQKRISSFHQKLMENEGVNVLVTDGAAVLLSRGEKWTNGQKMLEMRSSLRPCAVQMIRIDDENQEIMDNGTLMSVTTSFVHARESEKENEQKTK